jgi:intracellular protein transport protein USO1
MLYSAATRVLMSCQSYFKETPLFPLVSQLLQFPIMLKPSDLAPQEFALQFWDEQKQANASVIIGILGIFVNSKSSGHGQSARHWLSRGLTSRIEGTTLARCFLETALASNAPTPLKVQVSLLISLVLKS